MRVFFIPVTLVSAAFLTAGVHASAVGSKAPAIEPTEWLNNKSSVSWERLKGRLILVEKWATW